LRRRRCEEIEEKKKCRLYRIKLKRRRCEEMKR